MSDLLSALSLLLGVITGLAGLWHERFVAFDNTAIVGRRMDLAATRRRIVSVTRFYSMPLAVFATLVTMIASPPAVHVVRGAVATVRADPRSAFIQYDPIQATLFVVFTAFVALTIYLWRIYWRLALKVREIDKLPG